MSILRGADAILYSAARALGLEAKFRAVFRNDNGEYSFSPPHCRLSYILCCLLSLLPLLMNILDEFEDYDEADDKKDRRRLMISKTIPKVGLIPKGFWSTAMEEYLQVNFGAVRIDGTSSPPPSLSLSLSILSHLLVYSNIRFDPMGLPSAEDTSEPSWKCSVLNWK